MTKSVAVRFAPAGPALIPWGADSRALIALVLGVEVITDPVVVADGR